MEDLIIPESVVTRKSLDNAERFLTYYGIAEDNAEAAIIIQTLFLMVLGADLYPEPEGNV